MICRAGLIAALYVALTMPFGEMAFGVNGLFQIRPSEVLTILPLFYVEAIPGLYVGCMLANVFSQFGVYDIFLGSLATLLAAGCTWAVGKLIKNSVLKVLLGGFFPVVFNAFVIPAVILISAAATPYWFLVGSLALTESVWIYGLGFPLFFTMKSLIDKRVKGVMPYSLKKRKDVKEPQTSD